MVAKISQKAFPSHLMDKENSTKITDLGYREFGDYIQNLQMILDNLKKNLTCDDEKNESHSIC